MPSKICPYCKTDISIVATKCPKCGSFLNFLADFNHNWFNHLVTIIGAFLISISSLLVGMKINEYFDAKTSQRILKTEFESNYRTLQKLDACLKQTKGLLDSGIGQRTIMDLPNLNFTARDLSYKNNVFNNKIISLYTKFDELQNMIDSREQQRISMYNDINYTQTIHKLDGNIILKIKTLDSLTNDAGNILLEKNWQQRLGPIFWGEVKLNPQNSCDNL